MFRVLVLAALCSHITVSVYGGIVEHHNRRSTEISSEEDALEPKNTSIEDEPTSIGPECRNGGKVFVVNATEKVTWFGAYIHCSQKNMQFAVISDGDEYEKLVNAIKESDVNESEGVWISGYYDPDEEEYRWITRLTPMNYTVWREGRPGTTNNNLKCVELRRSHQYKMDDVLCTEKNFVACQTLKPSGRTC